MIFLESDTAFVLSGLKDSISGLTINSATVSGEVTDLAGNSLVTFSLPYIEGTAGDYSGLVTAADSEALAGLEDVIVTITTTYGGETLTQRERHRVNYLGGE